MIEKPTNGHQRDIQGELQDDPSMKELTDLVMDSLEEGYRIDWEPFEIYAQKLKSHIHTDPERFRQRFADGYERLIEVLHNTKPKMS